MTTFNSFVFKALYAIAGLIFVGLCIEAGALLVNFFYSILRPEFVGKLFLKLDLTRIHNDNQWVFYGIYGFIIFIAVLKVLLFYTVIILLSKLDMTKPFSSFVADKISRISYYTLSIGLFSYIARKVVQSLGHYGYDISQLDRFWVDSQAFILMAAVIFIIASIFRKGIEIQKENELTV